MGSQSRTRLSDWTERNWRVPECATQKYASFACGLFWARGYWEPADTGEALKAEHKFPFCKGNWHLCKRGHPFHSELLLSGEGARISRANPTGRPCLLCSLGSLSCCLPSLPRSPSPFCLFQPRVGYKSKFLPPLSYSPLGVPTCTHNTH